MAEVRAENWQLETENYFSSSAHLLGCDWKLENSIALYWKLDTENYVDRRRIL
jgi:hypothetical protein